MKPVCPVTFFVGGSRKYAIHQIFIPHVSFGFKTLDGFVVKRLVEQIQPLRATVGLNLVFASNRDQLRKLLCHVFVANDPMR